MFSCWFHGPRISWAASNLVFWTFFCAKTCCVVCHAYCFCYGTNMVRKNVRKHIPFDFWDDSTLANQGAGKTIENHLKELPWNQQHMELQSKGYEFHFQNWTFGLCTFPFVYCKRVVYELVSPNLFQIRRHCLRLADLNHIYNALNEYAMPKINMLHNLSCRETRFRLLCDDDLLHNSLNLLFRQHKLHNIFIFGMAYWTSVIITSVC